MVFQIALFPFSSEKDMSENVPKYKNFFPVEQMSNMKISVNLLVI